MLEPPFDPALMRAIIFDLDGTLYRQDSIRRAMLLRLVRAYAIRPLSGLRTLRVLASYRHAQESLRDSSIESTDLAERQMRLTCARTGAQPDDVARCVARWMEQEPLRILAHHVQPGLLELLYACRARGLRLAVVSDYPADAKLKALDLEGFFDVVLAAQSPDVGVFKPHPRGLLLAAERLNVAPSQCVYIGDRPEVDGPAAAAAGMACFILMPRNDSRSQGSWIQVAGYARLGEQLLGRGQNGGSAARQHPSDANFVRSDSPESP